MEYFDAAGRVVNMVLGSVNVTLAFRREVVKGKGWQMVAQLPKNVVIRPEILAEALVKVKGATVEEDKDGNGMICIPAADEEAMDNLKRLLRSHGLYLAESRVLWFWLLFAAVFVAACAHMVVVPDSPLLAPFTESFVLLKYGMSRLLGSGS